LLCFFTQRSIITLACLLSLIQLLSYDQDKRVDKTEGTMGIARFGDIGIIKITTATLLQPEKKPWKTWA